jgi:hypothetical protein
MKIHIKIKELIILTVAFILFTAIGTVSHEFGHITVAKLLGYETTLHYGSMSYHSDLQDRLIEIYKENELAIANKTDFRQKTEYEKGIKKLSSDGLFITMGGPIQTTLTGIIGLAFLFLRRKKIKEYGLKIIDWIATFLSLFWLREVFNLVISLGSEVISPNGNFFGGDEKKISEMLDLWQGTVSIGLGLIGLVVSLFIIFWIIPLKIRQTFILSGLIGGILGFILWMNIVGPRLIP